MVGVGMVACFTAALTPNRDYLTLMDAAFAPWGSETRIRSCGGGVMLVDASTEQIQPATVARVDRDRRPGLYERWCEAEGAMGSTAVVVLRIGPERAIEMSPWTAPAR